MFDWFSGKKDTGNLALTNEQRQRLNGLARALTSQAAKAETAVKPEAVLGKLLDGELSLVAPGAQVQITLTPDGAKVTNGPTATAEAAATPPPPEATEAPDNLDGHAPSAGPPVAAGATPEAMQEQTTLAEVAGLRQQVEVLQTRLNQRRDQQAAHQAKMASLMRKSQQQQQEIEALKAQVEELRQAAAIGQAQLDRWKFNNFSR